MTKRQLKKAFRTRVLKEGQSHQQVYEDLKDEPGFTRDEVAQELAKIPSKAVREKNRILVGLFIGLLAVVIILRMLGVLLMSQNLQLSGPFILLFVVLSLVIPVFGIITAARGHVEPLRSIGFLLLFGILRSFKAENMEDPMIWGVIIPILVTAGLAFWLPERMKTPFKRTMAIEVGTNGKERSQPMILFEEASGSNSDLLDSGI